MMLSIPVVLFVYNRPIHTKKTLDALRLNNGFEQYPVYIFSDGSVDKTNENWLETRKIISDFAHTNKNVELRLSDKNKGLAKSIITGVTDILSRYESVIVLEDDLVTSPYFLKYMRKGLETYKDYSSVGEISGFSFPNGTLEIPSYYEDEVYFSLRPSSWGWATWKDRWDNVDWDVSDFQSFRRNFVQRYMFNKGGDDLSRMLIAQKKGKVDSWAIRWAYNFFKNKWLTVYPVVSFVDNIGNDNSGRHSKASNKDRYENKVLNSNPNIDFPKEVVIDSVIAKNFKKVYSKGLRYYFRKAFYKLSKLMGK